MTGLPPFPSELRVPGRIIFGTGSVSRLGEVAASLGSRALLVAGAESARRSGALAKAEAALGDSGVSVVQWVVRAEPDVEGVDAAAAAGRAGRCDLVVAVGGGSAIDLAKSVAGMIPNEGSLLEYLEGVGTGKAMGRDPVPFIAVPTTAGTGSEVTRNAVLNGMVNGKSFKKSFRDPRLVPAAALVDPGLTASVPSGVTAACGMDALTQLIEPMVSLNATAVTDAIALSGIEAVARCLPRAVADGGDMESRTGMAYAALLSGICLSNAGLGAVHGLASPVSARALGGAFAPVPHGHICAVLLPLVVEANMAALRGGRGRTGALAAYERAERALGDSVRAFCGRFAFRGLGTFGFGEADIPRVVGEATSGSMKTNPVELTPAELEDVLWRAM